MSIKVNRNLRAGKIKSLDKAEIELLSESGIKDNEETLKKLKEELGNTNTAATVTEEKVTVLESASAEASDTLDALAKTIALTIKQVLPEAETTANMQTEYFRDRSWFSSDEKFLKYNFTTETQCETAPEDLGYGDVGGKALDVPDTSITTCANYMFYQSNYSKIPNLNTRRLSEAGAMFYGCQYVKELPEMDLTNLTNGNYMFRGCTQITKTPEYTFKNAPKAGYMFADCTNLQEIKLTRLDDDDHHMNNIYVTDPICMFQNCTKLQRLAQSIYLGADTTSVKGMFAGCTSLVNIPRDYVYNTNHTQNLTDMSYMFANCAALTDFNSAYLNNAESGELLPDSRIEFWAHTSNVTNMSYIFANCTSLEATPVFDCASVTDFTGAFRNCTSLGNIRMVNIKADLDISDCHGFDYSTTYKLIHTGLAEVEETKTLTINEDTYKMMYASDIEDANAKGWTIAVK